MINGINILKERYPDRSDKDYQPAGLDLRIGKLYEYDSSKSSFAGIIGGKKILPPLKQVDPILFNSVEDEPHEEEEDMPIDITGDTISEDLDIKPIKLPKNRHC